MKTLCMIFLTAFTIAGLFGCGAPAANTNSAQTNANTTGPPTAEALKAIETTTFQAYRNRDVNYFQGFLTDKFVGSANGRRLDKSTTIKMIAEHQCDIKSFSFADEKLTNVGAST